MADLASEAVAAGWKREHGVPSRVMDLESSLARPRKGWVVERTVAETFGEPERQMFDAARWVRVEGVPAVRLTVWERSGEAATERR